MTDETRELDKKTVINIAAAAAKHRHELPVTYRPSVRDVCETSYSMGAKEFYPIGFEAGRKSGLEVGVAYCITKMLDNAHSCITRSDVVKLLLKELEALKTEKV